MKIIEIILKLAFLAGAVVLFVTKNLYSIYPGLFIIISLLLGIVLILNKHPSYGKWGNAKKDFVMRKIEGVLLIATAIGGFILFQF